MNLVIEVYGITHLFIGHEKVRERQRISFTMSGTVTPVPPF